MADICIGLITCRVLPEPDPDQESLLAALRLSGFRAELLPWDDGDLAPGKFDLCVFRSCWNYHLAHERFMEWCDRASTATTLMNPLPIVRWNIDKQYLVQLDREGIPIVPTHYCKKGAAPDLRELVEERGWDQFVIKPAVSAASFRTQRFSTSEFTNATAFLAALTRDRAALIQEFQPSTAENGETAIVMIDDNVSHAVQKFARFDGDIERVSTAREVTAEEHDLAHRTLEPFRDQILYGRVDVMTNEDSGLLVSELELIEPSLFLLQFPPALDKLVQAMARHLR